jgi:chromate transporter
VGEARFLHALNYTMLLPGPEAQQLATYIGWLLHGMRGGLVAGLLFVLPGFVAILALRCSTPATATRPWCRRSSTGSSRRCWPWWSRRSSASAGGRCATARWCHGAAGLRRHLLLRRALSADRARRGARRPLRRAAVGPALRHRAATAAMAATGRLATSAAQAPRTGSHRCVGPSRSWPSAWRSGSRRSCGWRSAWGRDNVFTQIGVFFSKAAVVTFGGAYAVLAYIPAGGGHLWLAAAGGDARRAGHGGDDARPADSGRAVRGLHGGVPRTPGPDALQAGVLASMLTTWVTFVPCFLWIFLGAPYVERLRGQKP